MPEEQGGNRVEQDNAAPLREVWYFAMPGHALPKRRMIAKTILGEPLLLGRDIAGQAFALRDICPHRGIPLSCGRFDGKEVECPYHGWRFDTAGACTAIPSLVAGQDLEFRPFSVRSHAVREVQGNIWVYFGDDPADAPEIPLVPDFGETRSSLFEAMRFPAPMDHAIIGLMDPAHGPYVHRSWFWRTPRSIHEKAKAFAPSPWGFTMLRHAPSKNARAYRLLGGTRETEITFRLPGIRIEHIRAGRHRVGILTALTPITAEETEINISFYWTIPWLNPIRPLLRPLVRRFVAQDRDVIVQQQRGLKFDPTLLLINDADTQAKWYYRLKLEYCRARAENRAFANPVTPRVLRWRS
jgi:phenylpropionate dioxygenase-like ring-hydroxylating dioxygenase large terminal subunit